MFENQLRNDNYHYNSNSNNNNNNNNIKKNPGFERFGGKAPFSYLNDKNEEDEEEDTNDYVINNHKIINNILT